MHLYGKATDHRFVLSHQTQQDQTLVLFRSRSEIQERPRFLELVGRKSNNLPGGNPK
jgi:hypothetical protein